MKLISRIQYNSPVVLTYALLSLLTLLLGYFTKGASTLMLFSVYRSPMSEVLFYARLFGHVLGHINLEHYVNNFLLILLLGPMLEEKYGSKAILFLILTTALITGGLFLLINGDSALLGASGVVFMLILLSSYVNLEKGKVPITLILVVAIFIGREIFSGLYVTDNVSRVTHVVGGACGAGLGYFLNRKHLLGVKDAA